MLYIKWFKTCEQFQNVTQPFFLLKVAEGQGDIDSLNVNQEERRSSTHSQEGKRSRHQSGQERRKFLHHWIAGNLPLNSECEVCEETCGDGPGIVDIRCCWCQRYFHLKS